MLEKWVKAFILVGLPVILAFQLYMVFIQTPKSNDWEFCDTLKSNYTEQYDDMMENNAEIKRTCCQFTGHAGTEACK